MGKRILVIDDQEGVAKAVGRIARELGYDAKTLTSPDKALDLYIDYKPDVVMVDVIMPEKDGIDVLNEIMLTSHRARVVLTSGLSNAYLRLAEQVARFHNCTDVSVLRKPFRRDELMAVLRQAA